VNQPAASHDSETPARGQQVITACAFLHDQFDGVEKVFLAKRAATKKFLPGIYELPGGHINFGEDIVAGLEREIKEEFGMSSVIGDSFYVFTRINEVKGSHSIEVIYFAKFIEAIENIRLVPSDHSEYGWFAANEIHLAINDILGRNDPEQLAMTQGFGLLAGGRPRFS
jgi:8-oxo-dGTP diphosphatase